MPVVCGRKQDYPEKKHLENTLTAKKLNPEYVQNCPVSRTTRWKFGISTLGV